MEEKARDDSAMDKKLEERIQQLKQKQEENDQRIREMQEQEGQVEQKGEEEPALEGVKEEKLSLEERLGPAHPFELAISLGGEMIEELVFDKDRVTIGRDTHCDVHIDNLGASRVHAQIERFGRFFLLRDLESKTGTFVRGKKIDEYCLNTGDEIFLAKHTLVFKRVTSTRWHGQEAEKAGKKESREQLMQTMAVDFRDMAQKQGPAPAQLQFVELNRRMPVTKNAIFFGKSSHCDYTVNGFLISEKHAILVNERKGFVLYHLGLWKPPKVNEKPVNMAVLKEGDVVQIGDLRFIFRAAEEG